MLSKRATVVIFFSILFLPFILDILNIQTLVKGPVNTDNRILAKKPAVDLNALDGYPSHYSDYYNDKFPFREFLLRAYAYIKVRCFDKCPVPEKVVIGKDDWLFYKEGEQSIYDGTKKLTDSELNVYLNELIRRKKYLDERNCSMYIYVIPAKLVAYPEYLKKAIKKKNEQTEGEQLVEYIKGHSDIHITYLLSALQKAKDTNQPALYYKTDTHWTDYGAIAGCNEMIRQLSSTYSGLKPLNANDMATKDTEYDAGNISVMMKVPKYYRETKHKMYPKNRLSIPSPDQDFSPSDNSMSPWRYQRNVPDSTLPSVLIIGDSFMEFGMGFFAESFNHTAFIWDAWHYRLHESTVDKLKPNVVIIMMWEPELENILYNLN